MKILFDPIFTNDPQFCSMTYKMQEASKYLLSRFDDLHIRFALPADTDGNKWDINEDWLHKDPRLTYFKVPTYSDRMREYYRFTPELENAVKFWGDWFDTDIVITARIPMVPVIKPAMTSTRANRPYSKQIITVEDMPILDFKKCVAQVQPEAQNRGHVLGYSTADLACFMSYWERDAMLRVAREFLSPSEVKRMALHCVNSSPIKITDVKTKPAELVQSIAQFTKPFTIGYTQRYEKQHRRSEDIMKMFENQWVFRGGKSKMRFVSTSNSKGGSKGIVDTDFIEFLRPPREEFWRMMQEEVDVVVVMSIDDAYPLSLIEPILNGTPAVVLDKPYARATLSPNYPFFVSNEVEAYSLTKMFYEDYEAMYAKFEAWLKLEYLPIMLKRNEDWWPRQLEAQILKHQSIIAAGLQASAKENSVVDLLVSKFPEELRLKDAILSLKEGGDIRHLAGEIGNEARSSNAFTPSWNEFRLRLQQHHGYVDAGLDPGHLKRG